MKEQLSSRLQELKQEFERGQKKLAELDDESQKLRHMLLRISGGIQVLEEEIAKLETPPPSPPPPAA